ncbi:MAG: FIST N-terminal domain-containing protein, partial [Candidatus Bathyarchaeia archaeon]
MTSDFFLGFTRHAHTLNELETDQKKELELRRRNSPEEAQKLVGMILDKLEKDLLDSGYSLGDVKLLILYLSYRGEPAEKDTVICESILRAIENKFKKHATNQLRLIGHTTGGELENEDLVLKEISGIGYNGLSLLALVTNLPIGVGRTWGLKTAEEAGEQGREMARDAWIDFNQQTMSKEHLHMRKTLLVLTQGSKVDTPGYEHFLAEGIAHFMGSTREARIMNVIGGSSGDGVTAKLCRQFYGRLKEHPQLKVLDGEAVCVLIPNLCETSIGLDVNAITKIGRQHTFHFNSKKEPHYKYVKRIGNKDPITKYAEVTYENEVKLSKEKGLPMPDKETILEAARLSREQKRLLIFNPVVAKYAFAFPFGNYTCVAGMRVVEEDIELMFPIRSYTPEMPGYIMMGDHKKVQRGARRVYNMLREDQGFCRNDATFLVSCINRRIVELMAGCRAGTEAEILKEGLSSSQVIGFLAYGELSFTHLLQEPYSHAFSCWGITLRSKTNGREVHKRAEPVTIEVSKVLEGRISTGYEDLDSLLFGGIPENYAVVLTSHSCDERNLLIERFL